MQMKNDLKDRKWDKCKQPSVWGQTTSGILQRWLLGQKLKHAIIENIHNIKFIKYLIGYSGWGFPKGFFFFFLLQKSYPVLCL